jgi:cytochrome c-type biogenesis protein CcmH/NrfF
MYLLSNSRPRRRLAAWIGLLCLLVPAGIALAQSAAQIESEEVKRVGSRLACQCGSCKSTIACDMPGGCAYCKRVKTQIAQMQSRGESDQSIIGKLVQGGEKYLAPPGKMGFIAPYLALAFGLGVIVWFVRSQRKPAAEAPAGGAQDQALERYHDRIERDMEKLE